MQLRSKVNKVTTTIQPPELNLAQKRIRAKENNSDKENPIKRNKTHSKIKNHHDKIEDKLDNSESEMKDTDVQKLLEKNRTDLTIKSYGEGPHFFAGQPYDLITHKVNLVQEKFVVSLGQKDKKGNDIREAILLDIESQKLYSYFESFVNLQQQLVANSQEPTQNGDETEEKQSFDYLKETTVYDIIPKILLFTNQQFNQDSSEKDILALRAEDNSLSLETALENRKGSCRHKALLVAYLLVTVLKSKADGESVVDEVHIVRHDLHSKTKEGKLKTFPHAGVVYLEKATGRNYFLDATHANNQNEFPFFEISDDLTLFQETKNFYGELSFAAFWQKLNAYFSPKQKQNSLQLN